jgi:hypothetical protein
VESDGRLGFGPVSGSLENPMMAAKIQDALVGSFDCRPAWCMGVCGISNRHIRVIPVLTLNVFHRWRAKRLGPRILGSKTVKSIPGVAVALLSTVRGRHVLVMSLRHDYTFNISS